jgi:beta-aspartyl-peptidase (threonine type)
MVGIIVHGGAGKIRNAGAHKKGTRVAAESGYEILKEGGCALDAVIAAVRAMEDDPSFNAGIGSALNLQGEVEMDASVMLGSGEFGGVGAIKNIRHPVDVARKVMEETDHILLVGEGAIRFAKLFGFESYNLTTPEMEKRLHLLKEKSQSVHLEKIKKLLPLYETGTVGACALDSKGRTAVATSTGGILGKLPGRVGDSAIMGAGTYANKWGGVSATGFGEGIMKIFVAMRVAELMEKKKPDAAIKEILEEGNRHNIHFGAIGIDKNGNVGFGYNTESMSYAYIVK